MIAEGKRVLALCGGVGGAKLALGLQHILAPGQLTVVVNTGDDFDHLGLRICPDLDTVMYTLAGLSDTERGWGLASESWHGLGALERLGGETWFQLGDQDLATHLVRSQQLANGATLTEVTAALCDRLQVNARLLPMTDDRVATRVTTECGELSFQHYFVREQCRPAVTGFRFEGVEEANPQPDFLQLLRSDTLAAIIICPSNPFVSVEPILSIPGVRQALNHCSAPVVAVSPIIAGQAIKGPTAKMMAEMSIPTSAEAVAAYYGNLLDGFILDEHDSDQADDIVAQGIEVSIAPTLMKSLQDKLDLAEHVLTFSQSFMQR